MSIFGPIFTVDELQYAIEATLRTWFRTYLNEIELQKAIPNLNLSPPRSYVHHNEYSDFPDEQLPRCIIVSQGTAAPPKMRGDGQFDARWRIGVGIVSSGKDGASTDRNSKYYAAAVRAIILQKRSLGGVANGTTWEEESYEEGPVEADRTLAVSSNIFTIEVAGVVDRQAGPAVPEPPEPDDLPGSEWPTIATTGLKVERIEE